MLTNHTILFRIKPLRNPKTNNSKPKTQNLEMKTGLRWTTKQREVAQLFEEGKEFKDIIALGYSNYMTSKVKTALGKGQNPKQEGEPKPSEKDATKQDLVAMQTPKSAPIVFKIDRKEIVLNPLDLNRQYGYYEDLARNDNLGYSFSEILTIGIQLVWILKQNIPLTENMLRAIFYGYK